MTTPKEELSTKMSSTFDMTKIISTKILKIILWVQWPKLSYSAIFLESFDNFHGEDQYLLRSIILYLENFCSSRYNVPTFVKQSLW
jgi:hypothetical protein